MNTLRHIDITGDDADGHGMASQMIALAMKPSQAQSSSFVLLNSMFVRGALVMDISIDIYN